jgi:hypothetical protein
MERRKFLRNGGILASFFGAGVAVATESVVPVEKTLPAPIKEDVSHLAPPPGATTLQINGSYLTEEEKGLEAMRIGSDGSVGIGTSPYIFAPFNPKTTHSVAMTVGKDDRLWMKVGDTWHRVALES